MTYLPARYTVEQAADGVIARELAAMWNYDLIMLDINIPRLDGISLCRQLREQGASTPILMLTAQAGDEDVITGLDAGADDYVTKPFEVSQVLARVRALLRRGARASTIPSLVWGQLCLDPTLAQVTYDGQVVSLTPKEYSLLELFLRHPQRVFSRSTILDHLWTIDDSPTEGAVTNLVKDLRNRLKRSGVVEHVIQTVYGLGYRLRDMPSGFEASDFGVSGYAGGRVQSPPQVAIADGDSQLSATNGAAATLGAATLGQETAGAAVPKSLDAMTARFRRRFSSGWRWWRGRCDRSRRATCRPSSGRSPAQKPTAWPGGWAPLAMKTARPRPARSSIV